MRYLLFFVILLPWAFLAQEAEAAYVLDVTVWTVDGAVCDTVIVRAIDASGDTAFVDTTAFATSGHAYLSGLVVDTVYTINATKLGYYHADEVFEMEAAYTDSAKLTIRMTGTEVVVFENPGASLAVQQSYVATDTVILLSTGGSAYDTAFTDAYGRCHFNWTLAATTKYRLDFQKVGYPSQTNYFATDASGRGMWTVMHQASPSVTVHNFTGTVIKISGVALANAPVYFTVEGQSQVPDTSGAPGYWFVQGGQGEPVYTNASGNFTLPVAEGLCGKLYINNTFKGFFRMDRARNLGTIWLP